MKMKLSFYSIFILLLINTPTVHSQDFFNPYQNYGGQQIQDFTIPWYSDYTRSTSPSYNGEYEIMLEGVVMPWANTNYFYPAGINFNNFSLTYSIEVVSFPFVNECAFDVNGCGQPANRELTVPDDSRYNGSNTWSYTPITNYATDLIRISDKTMNWNSPMTAAFSNQSFPDALVSCTFMRSTGIGDPHTVYPHTVLKHTVYLHCGQQSSSPIISSFSWYYDLTRGRTREYPYYYGSLPVTTNTEHYDLLLRPEIISDGYYDQAAYSLCYFSRPKVGETCNTDPDYEGCPINFTPFDPAIDDNCLYIPSTNNAEYGGAYNGGGAYISPVLPDYSYTASGAPRNHRGTTLAGYSSDDGTLVSSATPFVHHYTIDKNINLRKINADEEIIYNPSEVSVTASNLVFPSPYTFKTIRAIYPFSAELHADNSASNGGPYTDLSRVPVTTDLYNDWHVSDYNGNDHRYASIYRLESGSKIHIEPCVKIFDATFQVKPNSELYFEHYSTNLNHERYLIDFAGGIVRERDPQWLFQNTTETRKILLYESEGNIQAGNNVDPNSSSGNYEVTQNAQVGMYANDFVEFEPGFKAETNGFFESSVYPIAIQPCTPSTHRMRRNEEVTATTAARENKITCTPNPTSGQVTFIFTNKSESKIELSIFDSFGKLVGSVESLGYVPAGSFSHTLNTDGFANGIYIVVMSGNSFLASSRFVVSK